MVPILFACLIWLPALVGLGMPLTIALRQTSGAPVGSVALRTAISGLLGMFVASTLTAIANFFVAIFPVVSTAIFLAGWIFAIHYRRLWFRVPWRAWRLPAIILLIIVVIDARGLPWYDTGLYHLQAVQWLTRGPLPAGLANLYECLGYNCSWFTLAAAIETPLLRGKSCFVVNALLAMLIALPATDTLLRVKSRRVRPAHVLMALMLIPLAQFGIDVPMISSLAPDTAVMLLTLLAIVLWVRSPRFAPWSLVLSCFSVTIKLSALPLFLLAAAATAVWLKRFSRPRRSGIGVAAFCAIVGVTFILRGLWISGYPAFPSSIGRVSTSWTAPAKLALHAEKEIKYWSRYARVYEQVPAGAPWLASWCTRVALTKPMLVVFSLLTIGVMFLLRRRPRWTPAHLRCLLATVALVPAVAFWFVTAPQPRFGYGYLFGIASCCMAMGIGGARFPKAMRRGPQLAAIIGLLLLMRVDRHLLKLSLLRWPPVPVALTDDHQLKDGVTIRTPRGDDRVWDAPAPATARLDPGLRCEMDARGRICRWSIVARGRD